MDYYNSEFFLVISKDELQIEIKMKYFNEPSQGYISRYGQLSISLKFYHFLESNNFTKGINWIDIPIQNSGVIYYKQTNDFKSLFDVLIFFRKLGILLKKNVPLYI